jgi:hypothetical protein
MKTQKPSNPLHPLTTLDLNANKKSVSRSRSKVMMNIDLADIDSWGADACTPPLPVLAFYGADPLHRFALPRGRFDIARLTKQFASRIVRSDSRPGGKSDSEDQDGWRSVLFHFKGFGAWLHYEHGTISTYAATRRKAMLLALKMERYHLKDKETGGSFELISLENGSIDTETVTLGMETILEDRILSLHYGEDFPKWSRDYESIITSKKSGLSILDGPPGTGKSSFIRHLMGKLKSSHRFFFVPPSVIDVVSNSSFVSFWSRQQMSHKGRQFVLVLEDSEAALMKRAADNHSLVSSLLSVTDGLLGDFMKIQVICTINCKYQDIDPALRRAGRLVAHRHFPRLSYSKACSLAEKIGRPIPSREEFFKEDFSLAEIYNADAAPQQESKIIGFAA